MLAGMAKITVSVPDSIADAAKSLADDTGTSVSALAARGLRNQVAEAAAIAYREWSETGPVADEIRAWREATDADAHVWESLPGYAA
jgi:hypothetical protein